MTLLLASPLAAQRGGIAAQQNLAELVERAGTIVRGRVILAQVEPHPNFSSLHTVVVTLRVQETFKGEAESTLTFRQFIWDLRDRETAAGYRKGGELLLFLTAPSAVGLTSPVGLGQGRFRILHDAKGQAYAINEVGNYGLFADLRTALPARGIPLTPKEARLVEQQPVGPVSLDELTNLVRRIAGGR